MREKKRKRKEKMKYKRQGRIKVKGRNKISKERLKESMKQDGKTEERIKEI